MNDEHHSKVIDIFRQPHHHEQSPDDLLEEVVTTPDGFQYISVKQERNCGNQGEESQIEIAASRHYVVKMMEVHHEPEALRINNYSVPGERLEEFLLNLSQRPGKLLEIQQLLPDHMA